MDYLKLGFKCGIEIHQQLEGHKLFCSCPTINSGAEPDIKVVRKLRAVAGETGEVDAAARHEMNKGKEFTYLGDSADVCLVETDSEPPHALNNDALTAALQAAKLLHMDIIDEIQVMRKTVVDGSNTSGFQRTMLVGTDGWIDTSKGKVRVASLCLEEEACQKLKEDSSSVTYRLDRLGIPLIEIGTEPDIKDAEHAKEAAGILGMILRSTGKAKRGLGTIRQDVNVSIEGHPRVEIKGFQELKSIPKVIDNEIERQLKELKSGKKAEAHVRKAEEDLTTSYLRPMPGAARMYPETDIAPIQITKEMIGSIEVPKLITEKADSLEKGFGLHKDVAHELAKEGKQELFERLASKFKNLKPTFIATVLTSTLTDARRKFNVDTSKVSEAQLDEILVCIDSGAMPREAVLSAIVDCAKGVFDAKKYAQVDDAELENEIKEEVAKGKGASFGAVMGAIMRRHEGKVDGRKVSELLKKAMEGK